MVKITMIGSNGGIVISFHQDLVLDMVEGEGFVVVQRNSSRS
jgi:hypothetical protein